MSANQTLTNALVTGVKKIEEFFGPLILSCEVFIGMLEENNQDPSDYFNIHEGQRVNFYKRRDELMAQREEAVKDLELKIAHQRERLKEVEQQEGESAWEEIAIAVIQELVKDGVKIKVGDIEWDSSKPLGGEGSVFDDLRNGTFLALGIDPDSALADILRDPFNKLSEVENLDVAEALGDIKNVADKALTDIKAETDKALTDIKNSTDKALSDVARETGKALTDARKSVDKAIKDVGRELGRASSKLPKIGGGFKW